MQEHTLKCLERVFLLGLVPKSKTFIPLLVLVLLVRALALRYDIFIYDCQ